MPSGGPHMECPACVTRNVSEDEGPTMCEICGSSRRPPGASLGPNCTERSIQAPSMTIQTHSLGFLNKDDSGWGEILSLVEHQTKRESSPFYLKFESVNEEWYFESEGLALPASEVTLNMALFTESLKCDREAPVIIKPQEDQLSPNTDGPLAEKNVSNFRPGSLKRLFKSPRTYDNDDDDDDDKKKVSNFRPGSLKRLFKSPRTYDNDDDDDDDKKKVSNFRPGSLKRLFKSPRTYDNDDDDDDDKKKVSNFRPGSLKRLFKSPRTYDNDDDDDKQDEKMLCSKSQNVRDSLTNSRPAKILKLDSSDLSSLLQQVSSSNASGHHKGASAENSTSTATPAKDQTRNVCKRACSMSTLDSCDMDHDEPPHKIRRNFSDTILY